MNTILDYFKAWKARLKSSTPKFFHTIIKAGIGLGSLGGALLLAGDAIPEKIHAIAGYMVAMGTVAAFIAKSAKESDVKESDNLK